MGGPRALSHRCHHPHLVPPCPRRFFPHSTPCIDSAPAPPVVFLPLSSVSVCVLPPLPLPPPAPVHPFPSLPRCRASPRRMPAMNGQPPAVNAERGPYRVKLFNDAILGAVELSTPALSLLDTPHAQRLRDLKQLGATSLVFPSASHCRLEHSLGVAATACAWVDALLSYPRRHGLRDDVGDALFDTPREAADARCLVQLAGLAHDLGHGPFSHLFDSKVLRRGVYANYSPEAVPALRHEWRSVMMLEDAVDECGLDVERGVVRAAAELIDVRRRWGRSGRDGFIPPWMMGMVASDEGAPDADRLDYLSRDSRYLNMPCGVDARRLMATSKVCGGGKVVGWPVKEAFALMDVYHTRYALVPSLICRPLPEDNTFSLTFVDLSSDARPTTTPLTDGVRPTQPQLSPIAALMSCLLTDCMNPRCRYKLHKMAYRYVGSAVAICAHLVGCLGGCEGAATVLGVRDTVERSLIPWLFANMFHDVLCDIYRFAVLCVALAMLPLPPSGLHLLSHRVTVGIDALLTDALLSADAHLHFTASIDDPSAFLGLDDTILHRLQFATEPALAPARALINRLRRRQLYPLCGELLCTPPTAAAPGEAPAHRRLTAADVAAHQASGGGVDLRPEDIVVAPAVLSYAMGTVNPVERIPFWEGSAGGGGGDDGLLGPGGVARVSRLVGTGACQEEVVRVYARREGADVAAAVRTAFQRVVAAWGLGTVTG